MLNPQKSGPKSIIQQAWSETVHPLTLFLMNSLPVSAWFSPSIDTDAQSMLKMLLRTIRDIKNGGEMGFSSLLRRSFSVRSRTVVDMGDKDGELRVFMVAGEVSGDSIASRLMASLKKLSPLPIRFSGVGG